MAQLYCAIKYSTGLTAPAFEFKTYRCYIQFVEQVFIKKSCEEARLTETLMSQQTCFIWMKKLLFHYNRHPEDWVMCKSLDVYEVSHWNLNMVVHQKIFNMNYSLGRQSHNSSSNVTFCISQGPSIFDWVARGMWDYWYPFFFFFSFFLLVYCMLGN